jgi:hypothetical protein
MPTIANYPAAKPNRRPRAMHRRPALAFLPAAALLLLLGGCAQSYQFRVDALRDPALVPAGGGAPRYVLRSGSPELGPEDLRYREIARGIERLLATRGYRQVDDPATADLYIVFSTDLSGPLTAYETRMHPVYMRMDGYSHIVRVPVRGNDGRIVGFTVSHVMLPPRTELAGYVDRDQQVTVYDKALHLSAREKLADGAPGREVWTVSVITRDASTDLRGYLPYLLAAAAPYIDDQTDGEVIVTLKKDDPALAPWR